MGMPITTYNVLNALDKGEPEYEIATARKTLEPFNLFAFIIHDPEAHPGFDSSIRADFNWLDYTTGQELLFFALVDPPDEWLNEGRYRGMDRRYYRDLTAWEEETHKLLNPENAITSPDRSITAFSLANSLEIPYDDLPCLVITPDFCSEQFIWVKTSSTHIRKQLETLGYIARQIRNIPLDMSLEEIKKKIDLCGLGGISSMICSIAKRLVNIMSCFVAGDNSAAHERAQNTINELRNNLRDLKRNINERNTDENEGDREKLDNFCLQIILFLSHLNSVTLAGISRGDNVQLNSFIEDNKNFLEPDSYIMLKTTDMVLSPLLNSPRGFEIDYTPGVICLAKVFEREVNLSVVHWMREKLGIRLPQYFNKYQPRQKASYDHVNFNRPGQGNRWDAPTMGRSLNAIVRWVEEDHKPEILNDAWARFTNRWEVITTERNNAAHTMELVDEKSVLRVWRALRKSPGIFQRLHLMKEQYRNR